MLFVELVVDYWNVEKRLSMTVMIAIEIVLEMLPEVREFGPWSLPLHDFLPH